MVNVLIDIPDKIHRRIKMLAASEGITFKEKMVQLLGNCVYIDDEGSWADLLADLEGKEG